jgi:hypothetical protein
MAQKSAGRKSAMTKEHKDALATGRTEGRTVRRYLEALESNRPKRGRKRTHESIERRLAAIAESIDTADPLTALKMTQERMDLENELAALGAGDDMVEAQAQFVAIAASYSARQGISYGAWREIGVPAAVLKEAGLSRSNVY